MKNVKSIPNHRRYNRKGVVDAQFNWIFILITGVVIFIFIIGIVMSQKRNADNQAGISAIKQITTILKGRQQSADVYSEINFPRTNINFRCEADTNLFTFKIENANRVDLPLEIIFAPQDISTNKMLVWGQKFSIGFPVSVFTYITTPDSIIILYNKTDPTTGLDNPYIKDIYYDLPNNISKKMTTDIDAYKDFKRVRIVCFADYGCPADSYSYLKISPGQGSLDYGNVTFHIGGSHGLDTVNTQAYLTIAGLYGAIFSDSKGYYDCQMSRAMSQLEVKRVLVEARLNLIYDDLDYYICQDLIRATLSESIGPSGPLYNVVLNWNNVNTISTNTIVNIRTRNEDLGLKSCPKMY